MATKVTADLFEDDVPGVRRLYTVAMMAHGPRVPRGGPPS